ncbi:Siroheme synthase [Streptomyces hirsutus]
MEAARGGRRVVRAVSGDPGLDAYAAEEMLACVAAGVPFEVVPGVAAAVGVPAYAGVPLRDAHGADVRFVDARTASDRCWTEVGASDGTVVVSSTLDSVGAAAGELVSAGRKPDTLDDGDGGGYDDPAADVDGDARDDRADAEAGEGAAVAGGRPAGDSRGR